MLSCLLLALLLLCMGLFSGLDCFFCAKFCNTLNIFSRLSCLSNSFCSGISLLLWNVEFFFTFPWLELICFSFDCLSISFSSINSSPDFAGKAGRVGLPLEVAAAAARSPLLPPRSDDCRQASEASAVGSNSPKLAPKTLLP